MKIDGFDDRPLRTFATSVSANVPAAEPDHLRVHVRAGATNRIVAVPQPPSLLDPEPPMACEASEPSQEEQPGVAAHGLSAADEPADDVLTSPSDAILHGRSANDPISAERARMQAILTGPNAATYYDLAKYLALETDTSVKEAAKLLALAAMGSPSSYRPRPLGSAERGTSH